MKSVVGIFNSLADAKRGAALLRSLGIQENRISVLAPGTRDTEVEARIPTADTEQPGMGQALGGTVGAALGVAGGLEAGAAVASILVPGVGPVLAIGLIGAALLGTGGAFVGAAAGEALEEGIMQGLPRDELYVYEDALRRGRAVLIGFAEDDEVAARARAELSQAGAESLDSAREEWWIGLRGAEEAHYIKNGGDFKVDEAKYRLGFEAALHPDRRGQSYEQTLPTLHDEYGDDCHTVAFRNGYERGRSYQNSVVESYKAAA
jgi:hypothetical protein